MNKLSRREFLWKSLLVIGGLTVGTSLFPSLADAAGIQVKEDLQEKQGDAVRLRIQRPKLVFAEDLQPRMETKRIVMHHIGGTNREVKAAEIHQWHLQNGWSGIGYHFVIHKDGSIEQGRPMDVIGAHCHRYNADSVGICSVGNFQQYYPTESQLATAAKLIAYVCSVYGLTPDKQTVFGHRDLNDTECPGDHYYVQLDRLRLEASRYL
ncbi:peptidoglycan recognition family protein [uncultured Megasphaera sp.]|uniref:peptidoglycan recognition protein family protein n=1 Tax=uncultured Megasphaera sp. TaxID=165188 RepID=UPI00259A5544|nr:peptidoglycan recognition family protein [uncultured Megasphaera sp.]